MKPRKNYNKQQNLEFYEWIKTLKMTDKEIEERKRLLNGDFEYILEKKIRGLKWLNLN